MSIQTLKQVIFNYRQEYFLTSYQSEVGESEPLKIDIRELIQEIQIFENKL